MFKVIPAIGNNSSFTVDLAFNQGGFREKIPLLDISIYESFSLIKQIIRYYGSQYRAVSIQAKIIEEVFNQILKPPLYQPQSSLAHYFGIETGIYQTNRLNIGLITDFKDRPLMEIISVQNEATYQQALALSRIRDEKDLLSFFGL